MQYPSLISNVGSRYPVHDMRLGYTLSSSYSRLILGRDARLCKVCVQGMRYPSHIRRTIYRPSVQVTTSRSPAGHRPRSKDPGHGRTCYLTVCSGLPPVFFAVATCVRLATRVRSTGVRGVLRAIRLLSSLPGDLARKASPSLGSVF